MGSSSKAGFSHSCSCQTELFSRCDITNGRIEVSIAIAVASPRCTYIGTTKTKRADSRQSTSSLARVSRIVNENRFSQHNKHKLCGSRSKGKIKQLQPVLYGSAVSTKRNGEKTRFARIWLGVIKLAVLDSYANGYCDIGPCDSAKVDARIACPLCAKMMGPPPRQRPLNPFTYPIRRRFGSRTPSKVRTP